MEIFNTVVVADNYTVRPVHCSFASVAGQLGQHLGVVGWIAASVAAVVVVVSAVSTSAVDAAAAFSVVVVESGYAA